jgi:hypothetical protein
MLSYELNTKVVTIYRDGSRAEQVLYKESPEGRPYPKDRPVTLPSVTDKIKTGFGNLYVTISFYNQKPFEVFTSIGKSGYTTMADAEALGRLISVALRSGVDVKEVIRQLNGTGLHRGRPRPVHPGRDRQDFGAAPGRGAERCQRHVPDDLPRVRRDTSGREVPGLSELRLEPLLLRKEGRFRQGVCLSAGIMMAVRVFLCSYANFQQKVPRRTTKAAKGFQVNWASDPASWSPEI